MAPSDSSAGPRNDGSVLNVTPSVVGVIGPPVPSAQPSFRIQLTATGPAALALNSGLFGLEVVRRNVAASSLHPPIPNSASNPAFAAARSNRISPWNSPLGFPAADTSTAPAPP